MTAGKLRPFWTAVGARGMAVMVSKEQCPHSLAAQPAASSEFLGYLCRTPVWEAAIGFESRRGGVCFAPVLPPRSGAGYLVCAAVLLTMLSHLAQSHTPPWLHHILAF